MEKTKPRKRQSKGVKHGGREKGTRNKRTVHLERLLDLGFDPFELARQIAAGEVKDTLATVDDKGKDIIIEVPLPWAVRQKSIHELMSYLAPKRKALEFDIAPGGRIVAKIERVIIDHSQD